MNKNTKLNIMAFLLSIGLILSSIIFLTGLVLFAISLGQYLPYVLIGLLFIGLAWILSIPIRDILEQREQRKQNRGC